MRATAECPTRWSLRCKSSCDILLPLCPRCRRDIPASRHTEPAGVDEGEDPVHHLCHRGVARRLRLLLRRRLSMPIHHQDQRIRLWTTLNRMQSSCAQIRRRGGWKGVGRTLPPASAPPLASVPGAGPGLSSWINFTPFSEMISDSAAKKHRSCASTKRRTKATRRTQEAQGR